MGTGSSGRRDNGLHSTMCLCPPAQPPFQQDREHLGVGGAPFKEAPGFTRPSAWCPGALMPEALLPGRSPEERELGLSLEQQERVRCGWRDPCSWDSRVCSQTGCGTVGQSQRPCPCWSRTGSSGDTGRGRAREATSTGLGGTWWVRKHSVGGGRGGGGLGIGWTPACRGGCRERRPLEGMDHDRLGVPGSSPPIRGAQVPCGSHRLNPRCWQGSISAFLSAPALPPPPC